MLLLICDLLETEDLMSFAEAWPNIADAITKYNVIRSRELRCFCLKKDYVTAKLGVGVALRGEERGNMPLVESEFDLLSEDAFNLGVYFHRISTFGFYIDFIRCTSLRPRSEFSILGSITYLRSTLGEG
jgi:hypothetical protein